ncbi:MULTISPECIES: tryptophan halogenase family protein [Alteromonas]|uniref:tryptophan halogenase family protein n=1 Tax=Alteromonas TaxID=226 RepID=UPI001274188C|nr:MULTISPECIES: tryptophan halogenase family protein [Alteromonas]CAI2390034.1 tryptophan halogenase [Alteromonas macleodii]CAI3954867.1 tryptophan halogenase [Alteromonas macleodii]CAI3955831.1 tryptophan halogenase [Alteromonas macleodii]CAI3955906.1 tryptophan halogenase [Alteromonas macleodii]VTO39630.1 tryptophan halogenase [Alteromonas macleodii]
MQDPHNKPIKRVVIAGGGTAGWLAASLMKKVLGKAVDITLVESEAIGTVGVGEATIPPIRLVNQVLGIDEAQFLHDTKATIKLAIRFENWKTKGESYYHTFGAPGKSMAFCHFHHYWVKARQQGLKDDLWDFDLNYHAAEAGRFAQINAKDPVVELPFAYHFDASLYAQYLRKLSENMGVVRKEGKISRVQRFTDSGFIQALHLESGDVVEGDLFVDCTGFKGLLIEEALGAGYDDWSHLLPCDSAIAVPSERHEKTAPYTRSIAHDAGWQWRIPLQHRNGNGHVYSSRYISDDQACDTLLSNLDTKPLGDPKLIKFTTGRRRKQWYKNVVAVGLSSGFLEPLESTSIHLIQSAIVRLIQLFPHNGFAPSLETEYNKQSELEFEQIRDFLVLHYTVNERTDSAFFNDMRNITLPDSLAHKIALFKESGNLLREQNDLFLESSWLQVLYGQGITPKDYHGLVDSVPEVQLNQMLKRLLEIKKEPIAKLPTHDEYINGMVAKYKRAMS